MHMGLCTSMDDKDTSLCMIDPLYSTYESVYYLFIAQSS